MSELEIYDTSIKFLNKQLVRLEQKKPLNIELINKINMKYVKLPINLTPFVYGGNFYPSVISSPSSSMTDSRALGAKYDLLQDIIKNITDAIQSKKNNYIPPTDNTPAEIKQLLKENETLFPLIDKIVAAVKVFDIPTIVANVSKHESIADAAILAILAIPILPSTAPFATDLRSALNNADSAKKNITGAILNYTNYLSNDENAAKEAQLIPINPNNLFNYIKKASEELNEYEINIDGATRSLNSFISKTNIITPINPLYSTASLAVGNHINAVKELHSKFTNLINLEDNTYINKINTYKVTLEKAIKSLLVNDNASKHSGMVVLSIGQLKKYNPLINHYININEIVKNAKSINPNYVKTDPYGDMLEDSSKAASPIIIPKVTAADVEKQVTDGIITYFKNYNDILSMNI
jgi:hypothetical protein